MSAPPCSLRLRCTRRRLLIAMLGMATIAAGCGRSRQAKPGPAAAELRARDLLPRRPFVPTDIALFDTAAYPDAPPSSPAAACDDSEQSVEWELRRSLARRQTPEAALRTGMATFLSEAFRNLIPDPRLRGALSTLAGTLGEAVPGFLLDSGCFQRVVFGPLESDLAIARAVTLPGEEKASVIVSDRYRGESLEALAPVLAHEALHQDDRATGELEEVAGYALHALIYAQLVRDDPEIVTQGTELTRALNTHLLARLNSGHPGEPELRLFASDNSPVASGSSHAQPDFVSFFRLTYAWSTPGNPLLAGLLARIANPGVAPPENPGFDLATLFFIDDNLNRAVLSAPDLVAVAHALRFSVPTDGTIEPADSRSTRGTLATPSGGRF